MAAGWYFNASWSWGFAKQGDPIYRDSCDAAGSPIWPGPNADLRMCWHTNGGFIAPGWRSGANIWLQFTPGFERFIFVPGGYAFDGFFAPIDDDPGVYNTVKAGQGVPVKFSLGGDQGLEILDDVPSSQPIDCLDGGASTDPLPTVTAGASGLSYDASTDVYTYTWKTEKDWTGCRKLTVKLDDGTSHSALFNFTR